MAKKQVTRKACSLCGQNLFYAVVRGLKRKRKIEAYLVCANCTAEYSTTYIYNLPEDKEE